MNTSIKINDSYVQKIMLGNIPVQRIYQSGAIVYDIGGSEPCFEVVDTISQATGNYVDIYAWDTSKWYKKNNLDQYEEYGVMPIVDSLSNITYYTGKLVILSTDNHEYRWTGTTWEDLGSAGTLTEYLFADPQPLGDTEYRECKYYPQYYFDNGYTFQVFFYLTPNYSYTSDYNMVGGNSGHAPIEMSFYSNGFYFDAHYPTSTPGEFTNTDKDYRIMANGSLNNYKGRYLLMNIQFNKVTVDDFHTGDRIYSSGFLVTKDFHDCGSVLRIIANLRLGNGSPAHVGWLKVFDNNGIVVNDIRPAIDSNDKLYWHDSLVNADYFSDKSYGFLYHTETEGELTPPVNYDTKVAPANNVHYDSLAELELMECPWNGMKATVGQNYERYLYRNNQWNNIGTPCFEVVDTISSATGDYIDVYANDTAKWYKKNNLNQYEDYGVMTVVDSLSTLTYYTGKMVVLATDNHEYKWNGSQWVDLGLSSFDRWFWLLPSSTPPEFTFQYHWDTGYKAEIYIYADTLSSLVGAYPVFRDLNTSVFNVKSGGYSLDVMTYKPASDSDNTVKDASSNRLDINRELKALTNYKITIENDSVTTNNLDTGEIYQVGSVQSITGWYNGYYENTIRLYTEQYYPSYYLRYIKIYDNNGNLVNHIETKVNDVTSESQYLSMYDYVTGVNNTNETQNAISYNQVIENLVVPYDYDNKVAPSDNVHYDSLVELEIMECPWVGMNATIGEEYTPYIYTENGWIKQQSTPYFTIESLVDNNEIMFYRNSDSAPLYMVKVSTDDGVTWTNKSCSTAGTSLCTLNTGEKVLISGNITSTFSYNYKFNGSGDFKIYGNILSLVYEDNFVGKTSIDPSTAFVKLFSQTNVVDAGNLILPVASLTFNCYRSMFESCTKLVKAPSLDSISSIGDYACFNMFSGCTSLITPINITVDTLSSTCCMNSMFSGCTSLTSAVLNIGNITLTEDGMQEMFSGCTSLEDVEINCNSSLPNPGVYDSRTIFYRCFYNCTSLTRIKAMMTSLGSHWSGIVQTMEWVTGVAATGTFIKNANATWDVTGVNGVPTGWTIESVSP